MMRQLSPRVQKVPTPQNVRSTSAESHPSVTYARGLASARCEGERRPERATTADPLGQALTKPTGRHSACSPAAAVRAGGPGQTSARQERPPSAGPSQGLESVEEEDMDAGNRGRVLMCGLPGTLKPRGFSHKSASPSPNSSVGGQASQEGSRLQYLESELAIFTSKMSEMRSVAEALQEEIHTSRPSPSSSVTTGTPTGVGPSFATAGDVIEALKKVLSKEKDECDRSVGFRAASAQNDLAQEMQRLHQELKQEAEARKKLEAQMETMLQEERAKRAEAVQQLEQCLRKTMQEESSLRRVVEGHIEERLTTSLKEMRLEVGSANAKAQQVANEFSQLRDTLRQEVNMQKLEVGNASADLSRLIDEVRQAGVAGDVASVTSTEMTENLVRAEVRRQLAERCTDAPVDDALALEMHALAARFDYLERALENEIASRQQEGSTFLSEFQTLMKEQGQCHTKAFQEFEDAFKSKFDSVMSEVQIAKEKCLEEEKVRCEQITLEKQDREQTAVRILRAVEEKIISETKHFRQALVDHQGRLEDFVSKHGQAVSKVVEKNSQELQTTRNDLMQLRDELGEVRHDCRMESLSPKMNGGTPMAYRLDIEELRTQVASERLAREQGDDRCMDNMRDLINEEQGKRGRELQALENRLSKKEAVCPSSFSNRPTTSICQTSRPTTMPTTTTMIQVQSAAAALSSFSA